MSKWPGNFSMLHGFIYNAVISIFKHLIQSIIDGAMTSFKALEFDISTPNKLLKYYVQQLFIKRDQLR